MCQPCWRSSIKSQDFSFDGKWVLVCCTGDRCSFVRLEMILYACSYKLWMLVVPLSRQCELHCLRCFLCGIGKRACSSQMSRENYTSASLMNGSTVSGGGLRGSSLMSWELKHCQSLPRPCLLRSGQSEEQFNSGPLKQRGMASRWFLFCGPKGRNNTLLSHASWGITAPNLIRGDLINWKMGISLKLSHA